MFVTYSCTRHVSDNWWTSCYLSKAPGRALACCDIGTAASPQCRNDFLRMSRQLTQTNEAKSPRYFSMKITTFIIQCRLTIPDH